MKTAELDARHPKVSPAPAGAPLASPAPRGGRTHWWVWVLLVLGLAGAAWFIVHRIHTVQSAAAAENNKRRGTHDVPVVVATARRGDLPIYLDGLGTVTPLNTVTVRSRIDGAIQKVEFTEGQYVRVGQPLLEIDARPYDAALKQAQGQLLKDEAQQKSAEWNVQQDTEALKTNAIAQQQIHTDTATRDEAAGAVEVDNALIAAAQVNVDYCHITSPIDGRIGLRLVDVGNIVHASDTTGLAVITQLKPITVLFSLPEGDIVRLQRRLEQKQPVPVEAFDAAGQKRLTTGTLLAVDTQIDPTTATVRIKAQFANDDDTLYPSQFVNARLLVDTVRDAVLVPTAAVQQSPTATAFVYVVGPDNAVHIRSITTGASLQAATPDEENLTAVTSGLQPGETVVTDGVDKLQEGSMVKARQAGATSRPTTRSTTGPAGAPRSGRHRPPA